MTPKEQEPLTFGYIPHNTPVYFVAEAGEVSGQLIRGLVTGERFDSGQHRYAIRPEGEAIQDPYRPTWKNPLTADQLFMPVEVTRAVAKLKGTKDVSAEKVPEYLAKEDFNLRVIESLKAERQKRKAANLKRQ